MYYLSSVCFLCLNNKKLINIYRNDKANNVVKQMKFVLPELVSLKKKSNLHICLTCCEALTSFYRFKKMCLRKYYRFYNYVNKLQGTSQEHHFRELQINLINKYGMASHENNIDLHINKEIEDTNEHLAENYVDIEDELPLCKDEIDPNCHKQVKCETVWNAVDVQDDDLNSICKEQSQIVYNNSNTTHTPHKRFKYTSPKEVDINLNIKEETEDSLLEERDTDGHLAVNDLSVKEIKDFLLEKHDTNEILAERDIDIKNELCNDNIDTKNYQQLVKCESVLSSSDVQEDNSNITSEDKNVTNDVKIKTKSRAGHKRFICTYCNKEFLKNCFLLRHMLVHTGVKDYCCTICKKLFVHSGSLKDHMRSHSGIKFECSICEKQFTRKKNLVVHIQIHMGIKKFKCTYCNKEFTRQHNLDRHTELHLRVKQFQCTVCHKQFNEKIQFKMHLLIHDGVKGFNCTVCNKQFPRKKYLELHMNIHNAVREYPCTICEKQFLKKYSLLCHMKIHTGIKEFTCTVCSKQFIRKSSLLDHMKIHDKQKIKSCVVAPDFTIQASKTVIK